MRHRVICIAALLLLSGCRTGLDRPTYGELIIAATDGHQTAYSALEIEFGKLNLAGKVTPAQWDRAKALGDEFRAKVLLILQDPTSDASKTNLERLKTITFELSGLLAEVPR